MGDFLLYKYFQHSICLMCACVLILTIVQYLFTCVINADHWSLMGEIFSVIRKCIFFAFLFVGQFLNTAIICYRMIMESEMSDISLFFWQNVTKHILSIRFNLYRRISALFVIEQGYLFMFECMKIAEISLVYFKLVAFFSRFKMKVVRVNIDWAIYLTYHCCVDFRAELSSNFTDGAFCQY